MKKLSFIQRFRNLLRANFIAGMFVALPLGITVAALYWIWQEIDGPLAKVFEVTDRANPTFGAWDGLLQALSAHPRAKDVVVSLLGMVILLTAVLVLGMLIRSILGKYLLSVFDGALARVPIAGTVYNALRQLAGAFVDDSGKSKFRRPVLVQFPVAGTWAIGFETSTALESVVGAIGGCGSAKSGATTNVGGAENKTEYVTVFVPTTPLPTQGFTLILSRSETRELPMTVQDAMKMVISGGILSRSDETMRAVPK